MSNTTPLLDDRSASRVARQVEALLREYPAQGEYAIEARLRLASLNQKDPRISQSSNIVIREILINLKPSTSK